MVLAAATSTHAKKNVNEGVWGPMVARGVPQWALSFRITVDGELDKSKPAVDGSRMTMPKQT